MSPLKSRLYRRLFLWFCLANIATLLVSVFLTERIARSAHAQEPDWSALAEDANQRYIEGGSEALNNWISRRRREGIDATLFEQDRNLSSGRRPPVVRRLPQLMAADSVQLRPRPGVLIAGQVITGSDGVPRRLIAERGPRPPPPRIGQLLLVQIALSLLVIGGVGWWLARSIAQPVAAVGDAARRVAGGDLSARVSPRWAGGKDEVGELARDFDRMAMRIETLVAQERSVLQDVSHELRSPLARLHLLLDVIRRHASTGAEGHLERAEREIQRLDRLIGEALALSRMESDLPGMEREQVELQALARERIADCRIDADVRGNTLSLVAATDLVVSGNPSLLGRALDNLLNNAIKFSAEGGRIEVGLHRCGERAELSVRDHGPGVPQAEIGTLFRPFFRGSNAPRAEGHGLGLAIVERILRSHQGHARAENADGGGLRVTLDLPLAKTVP